MRRKINRTSMWLLALTAYFIISFATPALAEERPNIFVQFSHANPVVSITSSQDGRFMLSGDGTTVKLWEIATGREIRTFWGQSTGALSPDGKYVLLTGKKDNSVTLFDINSGLSRSFKGHTDLVYSVAFSPDGKRALSASTDKTIRVWDISTMAEIRSFVAQEEPFKAFSSDGKYFITVTNEKDDSQNYPFTLWDITTGASKHFKGGTYPVRAVAVSSDGKLILTGLSFDKETFLRKEIVKKKGTEPKDEDLLLLWDSASGALIRSFKGIKGPAFSVALSPDARYALSGGMGLYGDQNVTLRLWDVATGSVVWSKKPALIVFSVAFSHDGRYVYGDSYDTLKGKTIKMWDVSTGAEVKSFSGLTNSVRSAAFSPDGKEVLLETEDKRLNLWDLSMGSVTRSFTGYDNALFAWAPDGRSVLVGGGIVKILDYTPAGIKDTYALRLLDLRTGQTIRTFKGHTSSLTSIAISSNGRFALSQEVSGIKQWDLTTGAAVDRFRNSDPQYVYFPAKFSGDGRLAAISGFDMRGIKPGRMPGTTMSVRNFAEDTELWSKEDPTDIQTTPMGFSPDGKYLLASTMNAVNYHAISSSLMDAATGSEVATIKGIYSHAAFAPDGRSVLIADASGGQLRQLEVPSGSEIRTFEDSVGGLILSLAISSDGQYALSGSNDSIARIWNLSTGKEAVKLIALPDKEWIAITPEGYYNSSLNGHKYLNISLGTTVYGIDQFYDVFYRPDIVQAKLRGEDISPMIGITIDDAIRNPPPAVKFTTVFAYSDGPTAKVCYQAKNTGGGIGEVRLFQNGKLIKSDGFYRETIAKAAHQKRTLTAMNSRAIQDELRSLTAREKDKPVFMEAKPKGDTFEECVDIETVPGDNEVGVAAFNAQNSIQSYLQTTSFKSSRAPEEPHLYMLSVGIDKYRDPSVNLKYAAKDARDFLTRLPTKAASIYKPQNIHVVSLSDSQAGKAGIIAAIENLSKKVKQGDGFIFFNASHGVLLQNQYYIVTADFDGDLSKTKNLISSNEIIEMSKRIKSLSQLFIFDTCHAGGIDTIVSGLYDARMSVMAKKMGLHIYASAGSVQSAMDGYQGNGLYTHTLLQGIENGREVDKEKSGKVTVKNLGLYSKERTIEISTKLGHPQTPFIINFGRDNPLFAVQ